MRGCDRQEKAPAQQSCSDAVEGYFSHRDLSASSPAVVKPGA